MTKSVLVNGTYRSGSGAVNDYLSSRIDFSNPFGDNEFRVVSDPTGLHSLYNFCYVNKNLLNPAYGFEMFENYIYNLQKYKVYLSKGNKGNLYNKRLINLTKNFIKKITKTSYYATPHYKRVNFSTKNKIKYSLGLKFEKKNYEMKFTNVIVPKEEKIFVREAKIYIEKIIKNASCIKVDNNSFVLNNAIDVLSPIESSRYFLNPKIIIVTRDPRDIFSSMKIGKAAAAPNYDVKIFVKWYKNYFCGNEFKKILKNKKILHIKFERFLNNFNIENKRLCKFLNVKENFKLRKNCMFDLDFSKKNIGKSKKNLSKYEINFIEKTLSNNLEW